MMLKCRAKQRRNEPKKRKEKGRGSLFVCIDAREFKIYGVIFIMIVLITYQDINDFIYLFIFR